MHTYTHTHTHSDSMPIWWVPSRGSNYTLMHTYTHTRTRTQAVRLFGGFLAVAQRFGLHSVKSSSRGGMKDLDAAACAFLEFSLQQQQQQQQQRRDPSNERQAVSSVPSVHPQERKRGHAGAGRAPAERLAELRKASVGLELPFPKVGG